MSGSLVLSEILANFRLQLETQEFFLQNSINKKNIFERIEQKNLKICF